MTIFESNVTIDKPIQAIYLFLADLNNHRLLMPDNIQDWVSTYDTANFNIQNMAKLSLKVEQRLADKEITIIPAEKPPFDMQLRWTLAENGHSTEVNFTISAELNMMMKMLASGQLQKLADHETQTLVTQIK